MKKLFTLFFCFIILILNYNFVVADDNSLDFNEILELVNQGNSRAQYELGKVFDYGSYDWDSPEKTILPDRNKAFYWYLKSAEKGNTKGQYGLGSMYHIGGGVPQDLNKAIYWYTKAAEKGNSNAQFNLGLIYSGNEGFPQDSNKAIYWYMKGAENDCNTCLLNLGWMYYQGNGVLQDFVTSYALFNIAASQGDNKAIKERDILLEKMSSEQITEGQKLSKELHEKISKHEN